MGLKRTVEQDLPTLLRVAAGGLVTAELITRVRADLQTRLAEFGIEAEAAGREAERIADRVASVLIEDPRQDADAAIVRAARQAAREAHAADVRRVLVRELLRLGLQAADADDLAQEKVLRIVGHLVDGGVAPGSQTAYVRSAGRKAAIDLFRRHERSQRLRRRSVFETADAPRAFTPETSAHDAEIRRLLDEILTDEDMPASYRGVLRDYYVRGRSTESLAAEDLERSPVDKRGHPRTLPDGRSAVTRRLSYARAWVLKRWRDRFRDTLM